MINLIFASLMLAQQNGPIWAPSDEVPDRITSDMCVEVHWDAEKFKGKGGIKILNPPLDQETIALIHETRKRKLGELKLCQQAGS